VLVAILLGLPPADYFTTRLHALVRDQRFDFAAWEVKAIASKFRVSILNAPDYLTEAQRKRIVLDYLDLVGQIEFLTQPAIAAYGALAKLKADKARCQPLAEAILERQISSVLAEEGLGFPPVSLHFSDPPALLVVSPRNAIRPRAQVILRGDLSAGQREALEKVVERELGTPALIVPLGGLALYPVLLSDSASLEFVVKTAAHEWAHHWLFWRPLGWYYDQSDEARTINEMVATLVGDEIGNKVLMRYYPELAISSPPPAFDYQAELRLTSAIAARLLAEGQIAEAEAYMEARRRFFAERGLLLTRMNQAYFAFHNPYFGDGPIGLAVLRLRQQSATLREFLMAVSGVTTFAELQRLEQ